MSAIPAAPSNNLPSPPVSFVGREKEQEEVKRLLSTTRLLTLTGSGGCGKTCLALRAAADLLADYPDGVWLIDLTLLVDPALMPQVLASALNISEESDRPLIDTLEYALRARSMLLIWDGCDRLSEACVQMLERLLEIAPGLRILATSRRGLGIAGETTCRVPSLLLPDIDNLPPFNALSQYEAVRLFLARAALIQPDFALTDQNALPIARICHRLDGIPLALELAAAQVKTLPVEEIAAQLEAHFRRMTEGSKMALPRQQTMRAALDWVYDRLSEQERILLRRLSIFVGGWTAEAAGAVCGGFALSGEETQIQSAEIGDLLARLVEQALVTTTAHGEESRFGLHETIRQYSRGRLVEAGELETLRGRHRDFFLELAEQAEPHLPDMGPSPWLDRLLVECPNLRAALEWCQIEEQGAEAGLRLAGALARYWYVGRHFTEGRGWLDGMLERGAEVSAAVRAKALNGAGLLARDQGDFALARLLYEECLRLQRELGDKRGIARTLNNLGVVAGEQGEYEQARQWLEESLAIQRELKDRRGIARTLNNLGVIAHDLGDYGAARALYEECLAIERGLKNQRGIALALDNLGLVAYRQGDYAAAHALFEECLEIRRKAGDPQDIGSPLNHLGLVAYRQGDYAAAREFFKECLEVRRELGSEAEIAECLEGFAGLMVAEGQAWRAARLYGAAESLREGVGVPMPPYERAEYDRNVTAIRLALGEEGCAREWEKGRALSLEQALEYALKE